MLNERYLPYHWHRELFFHVIADFLWPQGKLGIHLEGYPLVIMQAQQIHFSFVRYFGFSPSSPKMRGKCENEIVRIHGASGPFIF